MTTPPHRLPTVGVTPTAWGASALAAPGGAEAHPAELVAADTHLQVERTFSFVDLCGFTRFTRHHGPHAAVEVLRELRQVTRSVAAQRGVRVAKWLGDGVMLVGIEPTPVIALGAHLVHHFAPMAHHVRVGVAAGTALLFEGDDYVGEPVNLAFKLCDAADPGQMLVHGCPATLPDWIVASSPVDVRIKGVGPVDGVVDVRPRTISSPASGVA